MNLIQMKVIYSYYLFLITLVISSKRIKLEDFASFNINVYEVRINSEFLKNISMINALLFDCLCAIFLIDISNSHSFELIKDLTKIIKKSNFPNLNIILIQN